MKNIFNGLNKEQIQAVNHLYGPALLLAGAGTGKTTTLVRRTAYMIDSGVNPESILLLTFTNKAAKEMKGRIISYIGEENGKKVYASTFHSFCAHFLRQHVKCIEKEGYSAGFTPIDSRDQKEIIRIKRDKMLGELARKKLPRENFPTVSDIVEVYSKMNNDMVQFESIKSLPEKVEQYKEECTEILNEYNKEKSSKNYMDYDDLLYWTVFILKNYPGVRKAMNKAYRFVMCDEYQDTNKIQDKILDLLTENGHNLVVVGDDNQSIYRFRGACIENILSFPQRHEGCKVIQLVENYRSTQEILNVSNAMMEHATTGYKKYLKGQKSGTRPKFHVEATASDAAWTIIDIVEEKHKVGIPYKDMAVIIRNSFQSLQLEASLQREGIPFQKFGGIGFFQKKVVQDVLSYIRVAFNEKDELAWLRLLQLYGGIGPVAAGRLAETFSEKGLDVLTCSMELLLDKKYETLMKIHDFIRKIQTLDIKEQIETVITMYHGLQEEAVERKKTGSETKKEEELQALNEGTAEARMLLDIVDGYDTAKEFLEDIVFNAPKPKMDEDFLNITTIHSAKGLEYDTVILLNPVKSAYHRMADSKEENEETMRCLYVALTRAKNSMYLIAEEISGGYQGCNPNSITEELAHENVLSTMDCDVEVHDMIFQEEEFFDSSFSGNKFSTRGTNYGRKY